MPAPQSQSTQSLIREPLRRPFFRACAGLMGAGLGMRQALSQTSLPGGEGLLGVLKHGRIWPRAEALQLFAPIAQFQDQSGGKTPLVLLFGGNGMGAVVHSGHAEELGRELARRGVAAAVVNYANLRDQHDFIAEIIQPIQSLLHSTWAITHRIDVGNIAAAGFSAGGLIATLLATEYAGALKYRLRAAVNYYGPVDLRFWFAFHLARAGGPVADPFMAGVRAPHEMGHSAGGPILCRELSLKVVKKVSENMGGIGPGQLAGFSHEWLWRDELKCKLGGQTPILGVFGTDDDNCDPLFQSRLLKRMDEKTGAGHLARTYAGQHGASWSVCPGAVDWLCGKLQQQPALSAATVS